MKTRKKTKTLALALRRRARAATLLIALLCGVTGAWAQETLTVYDGTESNYFAPADMYEFDKYTRSQYIIPAADLEAMKGNIITALKYYSSTSNKTSTCNVDVYLKEVSYTTFEETPTFETKSGIVYTGTVSIASDGTLTITFTTPYTYNGGNLLIGMENTGKGDWVESYFYGQEVAGAVAYGTNSSSLAAVTANREGFIPKTTFTYEDGTYPKPADLTATLTPGTYSIADLSWTQAKGTPTGWVVEYATSSDFTGAETVNANTTSVHLTGLTAETTYYVRVKADYGGGNYSKWCTTNFTTDIACPVPTGFAVSNITNTQATATWNGGAESYKVMIGEEEIAVTTFDFEDGAIPASFTNDASRPWTIQASGYNSSSYCAIPGNKGVDNSNSYLTCEVTGPCTVSFYAKISSESNYDKGYFYIDDTGKFAISGSQDWTEYSYELGEGTHTLQWRYIKDNSAASGDDLFYVDNITMHGSSVSSWNEYTATEQSYTFSGLTPEKSYQVKVKGNYGTDGYSAETQPVSFTTLANDAAPHELDATDIYANAATLNWTGAQDSYNVRYRIPSPSIIEGFEDADEFANWTVISNNTANDVSSGKLGRIGDAKRNGNYGFRFSSYSRADDYNQYLISPEVSGAKSVEFWYKSSNSSNNNTETFKVGYSTTGNDVADFNNNWGNEIQSTSSSVWTKFELNLPDGVKYVAINYYSDYKYYLYIDDMTIDCGSAGEWVDKTNVTSPLDIDGLEQETKYEWQVQGIYNGEPTEWSTMTSFTTTDEFKQMFSGEGTEASPYLIASTTDWNNLSAAVNGGETYNGNYFKMTANVGTVSTWMTGTFSGTFDGYGKTLTVGYSNTTADVMCAPFGTLSGATIQNLKVAGSISSNQRLVAGIAALCSSTGNSVTNCLVSATINSSYSGNAADGGLVSLVDDGASLNVTGCAFAGKMLGGDSYASGGIVGWRRTGTCTLTNCLYAPASATGSEVWMTSGESQDGSANFCRYQISQPAPTIENCYYTTDFSSGIGLYTAQGMQARSISAGDYVSTLAISGDATATYDVSGITVYSGGIDFNDGSTTTFYGGSGQTVSLDLTAETRDGYQFKQYAASQGTLSAQTATSATLTMPAATGETLYTTYTATAGPSGYAQLVDNNKSTKVCTTFTSGVYIDFNTPNAIVPTGYVITTANDASSEYWRNRSPKTWKLYGKLNTGDSWTVLDDVADGNLPNEDTTDKSYSIANTGAYKYFRYEITAIKGSTPLFQIAELQLKGYDAVVISAEYDPTYNATFASGNDNDGWDIDPEQQIEGGTVTVSYTGENKVKSVTVTNKYAIAHSLAESVVGDIVGTDGNAYAVTEKGKLPVGVTAAGVVTYKSGEKGIVVALQNLATQYSWSDAFTAAAAYTPTVSGQTWKLGTKDEMSNAIVNDYATKYGYITAAGGTFPYPNNYWSATEVDGYTDRAWRIWVESNGVPTWHDWDGVTKATECQVRPIIAF